MCPSPCRETKLRRSKRTKRPVALHADKVYVVEGNADVGEEVLNGAVEYVGVGMIVDGLDGPRISIEMTVEYALAVIVVGGEVTDTNTV